MKNYFKYLCFAGSLAVLTVVASCSKDDDDDATPDDTETALSFATDIKPIIENNCAPCHTGGGQTDYTMYEEAKNKVDWIIARTGKDPSDAQFMPKGGEALSAETIEKIKEWKENGLAQ